MFDAHSYNKGGIVLHMLRNMIGDDAFFTALKQYLTKHAYTDVEVHELRMAFEEVTGQDLNWFFNQWYMNSGHPELDITKNYDGVTGKLVVTIAQRQGAQKNTPVYRLPMAIDVYYANGEKSERFNITTNQRKETFSFKVKQTPKLVNVDAERITLCEMNYPKTEDEYAFQYNNAPLYLDRIEAIESFQASEKFSETAKKVLEKALNDKHYSIRSTAVNMVDIGDATIAAKLENAVLNDAHSEVRGAIMFRLGQTEDKKYVETIKKVLDKERAFVVISEALQALYTLDKEAALKYLPKLENEDSPNIVNALAVIYSENPTAERVAFFDKKIKAINGMEAVGFISSYAVMSASLDDTAQEKSIATLKNIGTSMDDSPWRRYGAVKGLSDMKTIYRALNNTAKIKEIDAIMAEVKNKETNKQLRAIYDSF